MSKDKNAVALGKKSYEARIKGKSPEEIKEMMSALKKGKKKLLTPLKKKRLARKTNA